MKGRTKRVKSLPQPLPTDQATAIRQACLVDPNAFLGARDHALIVVLLHGLRVGEARQLKAEHLELVGATPNLVVRFGKGGIDRRVPLDPLAVRSLTRQLTDSAGDIKQEGWVFVSARDHAKPMTEKAVQRMVKRRAIQAGVPKPSAVHPHRFRHTFAVGYLERGGNVRALQQLMGHSDLDTTAEYLRLVPDYVDQDARATGML